MDGKHTPGPWKLTSDEDGWTIRMGSALADNGHWQVQHRIELEWGDTYQEEGDNSQYEEAEANARLLRAAPEMLDALEMIRDFSGRGHFSFCPRGGSITAVCTDPCRSMLAAIARARGED